MNGIQLGVAASEIIVEFYNKKKDIQIKTIPRRSPLRNNFSLRIKITFRRSLLIFLTELNIIIQTKFASL